MLLRTILPGKLLWKNVYLLFYVTAEETLVEALVSRARDSLKYSNELISIIID